MSTARTEPSIARERYVPGWPTIAPWRLIKPSRGAAVPFPFCAEHKTWFYRASNAIYHLFRALELGDRDVVLAPDYHSGNEIWAMRAAGARIVFYPVTRDLKPDMDALERLIRVHRPRVVYLIHYMGWPQPVDAVRRIAGDDTVIVEDCALSMFGRLDGRPLGSIGDYSIYCLYKTLPAPNGGLLVQNDRPLPALDALDLPRCDLTTVGGRTAELVLEWTRSHARWVGDGLERCKRRFGRTLTSMGVERVQVGNIGFDPSKVNLGVSPISRRVAMRADEPSIRGARRDNYRRLQSLLPARIALLKPDLGDDACPLFLPMLVRDKAAVAAALRARGVTPIEFWNFGDPEGQRLGSPDAQYLRDRVLGLPIHQHLTPAQLDYIAAQMTDLQALC